MGFDAVIISMIIFSIIIIYSCFFIAICGSLYVCDKRRADAIRYHVLKE